MMEIDAKKARSFSASWAIGDRADFLLVPPCHTLLANLKYIKMNKNKNKNKTHLYPSEQTLDLVLESLMIVPNTCALCLNDFCNLLPFVTDLGMRRKVGID